MKYSRLVILAAFTFVLVCCNKSQEKSNLDIQSKKIENIKAENFDAFNAKFHSDSVFQISRVDFPIEGTHVSGFERYNWTRKNWQFLPVPVSEKNEFQEYQHTLVKTDTLITEKFWIPDSGFEVERQFKLIDKKWFLIYYNDINL
ncbi:hypothetical protein GKZ90_0002235 [Flavobacterium sp. MC2016-06]|uniref:hypothetical protein n=1 Tax=Flavobacterium sp. MC2016-06 TaxID=2676308 RepID=UPI0012BA7A9D|nr:hypothetical protein [Flavobacterium sp. MC2016-06]MBU3858303.1 hypothetical protein [Flavobacterium sp. MC2016-06]